MLRLHFREAQNFSWGVRIEDDDGDDDAAAAAAKERERKKHQLPYLFFSFPPFSLSCLSSFRRPRRSHDRYFKKSIETKNKQASLLLLLISRSALLRSSSRGEEREKQKFFFFFFFAPTLALSPKQP